MPTNPIVRHRTGNDAAPVSVDGRRSACIHGTQDWQDRTE
jgi:hypothetical protein